MYRGRVGDATVGVVDATVGVVDATVGVVDATVGVVIPLQKGVQNLQDLGGVFTTWFSPLAFIVLLHCQYIKI